MLTLTGNGRITRDVALRTTHSGRTVAAISVLLTRRGGQLVAVESSTSPNSALARSSWRARCHAPALPVVPEAGHLAPLEIPDAFHELLLAFPHEEATGSWAARGEPGTARSSVERAVRVAPVAGSGRGL